MRACLPGMQRLFRGVCSAQCHLIPAVHTFIFVMCCVDDPTPACCGAHWRRGSGWPCSSCRAPCRHWCGGRWQRRPPKAAVGRGCRRACYACCTGAGPCPRPRLRVRPGGSAEQSAEVRWLAILEAVLQTAAPMDLACNCARMLLQFCSTVQSAAKSMPITFEATMFARGLLALVAACCCCAEFTKEQDWETDYAYWRFREPCSYADWRARYVVDCDAPFTSHITVCIVSYAGTG
jgi:hypothetical protein